MDRDVGDMPEIPCYQIIETVGSGYRNMQSIDGGGSGEKANSQKAPREAPGVLRHLEKRYALKGL